MNISQEELQERRRRAKDLLQNIQKEDLTPEEKRALQQCADDMWRTTTGYSLTGLALSYSLTRLGRVPLGPKILFNVVTFMFGGYLGMQSASEQCVRRLTSLESSKIGDLVKLSMTNTPLAEIPETFVEEGATTASNKDQWSSQPPATTATTTSSTRHPRHKKHDHHLEKVDTEDSLDHKPLPTSELLIDEEVKPARRGGPKRNQYGDIIEE